MVIVWLAPRAGKMKRILCSDWLPERERLACLARPLFLAKAKFFGAIFWPYNKSFIGQACSVKMADIGLVLCCILMDSTSSRSNIQPYHLDLTLGQ